LTQKKVSVVEEEAKQLMFGPFEPHDELATDEFRAKAGEKQRMHLMIVAEDDPRYTVAISTALAALSQNLHYSQGIKFVLFHTGEDSEVRSGRWPYRWTVFDRGYGREALPEEIASWLNIPIGNSCSARLIRAGKV
jgi:hypothetical protein